MSIISLRVTPANHDKLADLGRALITSLSDAKPEERILHDTVTTKGDTGLVILTLLLQIPGTIDAICNLKNKLSTIAGRREIRKRIEPPLESAKELLDQDSSLTLHIGAQAFELGNVSVDDVLDALADAERGDKK